LKDLIEFIARALVDHPEQVSVTEAKSDRGPVYRLAVAPDDVGKVIGRGGRLAKSLRTVVAAAARDEHGHITIDIVS
jgi:predicted RNA-binding protein YlqC (UPF0109 family)